MQYLPGSLMYDQFNRDEWRKTITVSGAGSGESMQISKQPLSKRNHLIIFRKGNRLKGFTLVEILIVVIILGILASIIIPRFSSATEETRDSMLKEDLRNIRTQINIYALQHRDNPPGVDTSNNADAALFTDHLTGFSDIAGNSNSSRTNLYCFGPYLSRIPANPINNMSTVAIMNAVPNQCPGTNGWIYIPETLTFIADLQGDGFDGKPYSKY